MAPGLDPKTMRYGEYSARLWHWNDRIRQQQPAKPDKQTVDRSFAIIEAQMAARSAKK